MLLGHGAHEQPASIEVVALGPADGLAVEHGSLGTPRVRPLRTKSSTSASALAFMSAAS
jgi:hypothetical protein